MTDSVMNASISPASTSEHVLKCVASSTDRLSAYWLCVDGDRDAFVASVNSYCEAEPIVAVAVRGPKFDDPNSVPADLVTLLNANREVCERKLSSLPDDPDSHGAILLVSRTELRVPQVASPVTFPDWFPVHAGECVNVVIEDITWSSKVSLSSSEFAREDLQRLLFDLDGALLDRLSGVESSDRRLASFLTSIRMPDEPFKSIFPTLQAGRSAVSSPVMFRPNLRSQATLISRVVALSQRTPPDNLPKACTAFAEALRLPAEMDLPNESVISLLFRPNAGEDPTRVRFARSVLLSSSVAFRLVTVASHADEYGQYPLATLRSLSFDLRTSLDRSVAFLESLPAD